MVGTLIPLPGNEDHAARLANLTGWEVTRTEIRTFPDQEVYVRIDSEVRDKHVVLVGSLDKPAEKFLMVAFLAATARDLGAARVGLVAPYLSFMRQDSRFHAGEGLTSVYFARLLSGAVDWLITVDPHLHRWHSLDALYSIPTTVVRAAEPIASWIQQHVERPVLIGPDAESEQWVAAVARACDAPFAVLEKTRRGDRDVSVSSLLEPWSGHVPVVVDDIISTGRTMVEATRQVRAAGAAPAICIGIHAVFADAVQQALHDAGAARVITCNTIAHSTNAICVGSALATAALAQLAA
ncbi:MAG: ribose-phosphate pyrophosphokinase [Kofleriaceae bacterium]